MFNVNVDFTVRIENCPKAGIASYDFRAKHGLPTGDDDRLSIKVKRTDEALCRQFIDACDGNGDLCICGYHSDTLVECPDPSQRYLNLPAETLSAALADEEIDLALILQACGVSQAKMLSEMKAKRSAEINEAVQRYESLSDEELADEAISKDRTDWNRNLLGRDVLTRTGSEGRRFPDVTATIPEAIHIAERIARLLKESQAELAAEVAANKAGQGEWIKSHGSDRLKACWAEDVECRAIYLDERLKLERPDWQLYDRIDGSLSDPRNPPAEAFDLLLQARTHDPKATLYYYECGEVWAEEDYGMEQPTMPTVREYVAASEYLGRRIVFGATR